MSDLSQPTHAPVLLDKLQWRYATKKMDPSRAVPQDKVDRIVEAARLAPTSSGLQPFEIIVVTSKAVREQIQPIAWNQAQITDGSHLLVFAAWDTYTAERISRIAANDLHIAVHHGHTSEEVMVPFVEVQEIKVKHRDAK